MNTLPRLALRLTAVSLVALPVAAQARVEVQTLPTTQVRAPHQVLVRAPKQAATPFTTTTVRRAGQQAEPCCEHECGAQKQAPARIGFGLPKDDEGGNVLFLGGDEGQQELRFSTQARGSGGKDHEGKLRIRVEIDDQGEVRTHVERDDHAAPHAAHEVDGVVIQERVIHRDGEHEISEGLMVGGMRAPHAHHSEDVDVHVRRQHDDGEGVEVFKAIVVGPDGKQHEFDSRGAFEAHQRKAQGVHTHDASDGAEKKQHMIWVGPHGAKHELKFAGPQEFVFPAPRPQRMRWIGGGSAAPHWTRLQQSQGSSAHGCCCCGGGSSGPKQIEIHVETDVQGPSKSEGRFEVVEPEQPSGDVSFGWTGEAPGIAKTLTLPEDVRVHVFGRQGEAKRVSPGVYTFELDGDGDPLGAALELRGDLGGLLERKGLIQHLKGPEGLQKLHGKDAHVKVLEGLEGLHEVDVHLEGLEALHEVRGILRGLHGAHGDGGEQGHRSLRRIEGGEGASIELELPDFSAMDADAIRAWAEAQEGSVQVWTEESDVEQSSDEAPEAGEEAPAEKAPGAARASQEIVIV